ncbi:MAG TPA: hypothetical protein VKC17_06875 [Sphingomicrobium sp.]|nr:hypothetical protein [Sphingomicrobium sp.]
MVAHLAGWLVVRTHGATSMSMCDRSLRPYLNPVSPTANAVARSSLFLSTVQSAKELSNWK